jgi:hypothetical protein
MTPPLTINYMKAHCPVPAALFESNEVYKVLKEAGYTELPDPVNGKLPDIPTVSGWSSLGWHICVNHELKQYYSYSTDE